MALPRNADRIRLPALGRAPYWHTGALVGLISCVAVTGTFLQRAAVTASGAAPREAARAPALALYVPILIANCGLTLYVCRLFRGRNALPELIGRRWDTMERAIGDLAIALVSCAIIQGLEVFAVHYFGATNARRNAAAAALLPHTGAERLTWCLVASCVGFSEEVVYRGYLQTQLAAWSHRQSVGIVLQAVLFGVAHADQGYAVAVRVGAYGLVLGVVARARQSLMPVIVSHVAIDLAQAWLH